MSSEEPLDLQKIAFLEDYVLSDNRLKTTSAAFNEDTEEYWTYSLMHLLNKTDGAKDTQTKAFLAKLAKSPLKDTEKLKQLLFRRDLKAFDQSSRDKLVKAISEVMGCCGGGKCDSAEEKKADGGDAKGKGKAKGMTLGVGTRKTKKGGVEVDTAAAIAQFLKQADEEMLKIGDFLDASAIDELVTKASLETLTADQLAGIMELIADSAPTAKELLPLIHEDLKQNNVVFGSRAIHKKLTVEQLKTLGTMDKDLYKNLPFVTVMAGKLRPISDVNWQNNEAYCKAYLDKLRAFAKGPLKHVTFKALILYNCLRFYEALAKPDGNEDVRAYQAAVYGNDTNTKKGKGSKSEPKFPTYDSDILKEYLSLSRRGAPFTDKQASEKAASDPSKTIDVNYMCADFPELAAIGDDLAFVQRALGFFFLKGDLTGAWPMVKKEWALIVFAKEKLMAAAGNDKFLKAQEGAVKEALGAKGFAAFARESQLRLFETNKKFYKAKEAVTIEFFTKNNPELLLNVYELNAKNYYMDHLSEVPTDISLAGAVPYKSITKKYAKDKSIVRRADSVTLKSLANKRGLFVIDLIGKNISARAFIRKGELRFIYEQTDAGYDVYVFDETYKQIMAPRIFMDGQQYDVAKVDKKAKGGDRDDEKSASPNTKNAAGKITLPFSLDIDRAEQLIIIEDTASSGSCVLRSFVREVQKYSLRGGFYVDREQLLSKQTAKLLIRANLYLCQETATLGQTANSSVTLEFKTLDNAVKKDVRRVELTDTADTEIEFTVPTNLREVSCRLETMVNGEKLSISHAFKVNGIDACPFLADVFVVPDDKKGYVLMTVGKNGEAFADEEVTISLFHKFFRHSRSVTCTVRTNADGLFELGKLTDVTSVKVTPKNNSFFAEKTFNLLQDLVNVPARICRKGDSVIRIPFAAQSGGKPKIAIYDAQFSSDISKTATYKPGYVVIEKLPPGDYTVFIDDVLSARVALHVSAGTDFSCPLGEYVLSNSRILQLSEDTPLQITGVAQAKDGEEVTVSLSGYNDKTRVHVIVTSLLPVFTPYQMLCAPMRYPDVIDFVTLSNSTYSLSAQCDAELMYILGRAKKNAAKYNGNTLYKPSMVFGKYAPPQQSVSVVSEPSPTTFQKMQAIFKRRYANELMAPFASTNGRSEDTSNVEFLPQPSLVFSNLRPDPETGVVAVPSFNGMAFRCVQVIAADDDNTALFNFVPAKGAAIGRAMPTADIRLAPGFDPTKHYSPCRKICCLSQAEEYKVSDIKATEYVSFAKLASLFDLYSGLSGENVEGSQLQKELEQFRPLTVWPTLSDAAKLDFYDARMCHEVNYFLFRRDRAFFDATVKPVLQSKVRKEFMDLFLLDAADLAKYADAYLFSTLNVFEKILFASRSKDKDGVTKSTLRAIEEAAALLPRNPRENDRVFAGARFKNKVTMAEANANASPAVAVEQNSDEKGEQEQPDPFSLDETVMVSEQRYFGFAGVSAPIAATKFWKDFALWLLDDGGKGAFLSPYCGHALSSLNEMLLALAVVDLPFDAAEPTIARDAQGGATLTPNAGAAIVFMEELVESTLVSSTLSVHSNYFDPCDSSEIVHGEKVDKFVLGTFETRKIYGCRSVITNVSSVEQSVEVLLQIPTGAVPVNQSYLTKSYRLSLAPFMTERQTYYFYFPAAGDFRCFPVHINKNGKTVAYSLDARLVAMKVVGADDEALLNQKGSARKSDWGYLLGELGNGSNKDVLSFLASNARAFEVDLGDERLGRALAADAKLFDEVTAVLKSRGLYSEAVWRYALVSDKGGRELAEYVSMTPQLKEKWLHPFFGGDGDDSSVEYDPVERADWNLAEFAPLICPRAHSEGVIQRLSASFLGEYARFLLLMAFRSSSAADMAAADKLVMAQFLLCQRRTAEAKRVFVGIAEKEGKAVSPLLYELVSCFLSVFHSEGGDELAAIKLKCMTWKAKPLPARLLAAWQALEDVAKEVEAPQSVDALFDAELIAQTQRDTTPFLNFECQRKKEQRTLDISFRNVSACVFRYYAVDLELLFSASPFSLDSDVVGDKISLQSPNESVKVSLPKESSAAPDKKNKPTDGNVHHYVELPEKYRGRNCIIECVATAVGSSAEVRAVHALNDNSFAVQFDRDNALGQCRVVYNNKKDKDTFKKPITGAYCKVYSRDAVSGEHKFFKDGYTDIRGRFAYRALSTDQLQRADALAMFVRTPNDGATVVSIDI